MVTARGSMRPYHKYVSRTWNPTAMGWDYTYPAETTVPNLSSRDDGREGNALRWLGQKNYDWQKQQSMADQLDDQRDQAKQMSRGSVPSLREEKKEHKGVLVAFFLNHNEAAELVQSGEDPDEMHLSVAYLGDPEEIGQDRDALIAVVRQQATMAKPFTADVTGVGRFTGDHDGDGRDPLVAHVESSPLVTFRNTLVAALEQARFHVNNDFPFKPHVTLGYVPVGEPAHVKEVPHLQLQCERATLCLGDERLTFKLGME